ncbi:hypothetical protein BV898_18913 [Hypsibius exemplaris]|uniref:Uncharacterized protein n=1 Tax=Hypsibius exemplaris TaxID=2072580 RepID=A0A9X6RNL5_HYPEX|nr:hypothetical protein BV898_18913 [Hypsibius exemplaris]
MARSWSFSLQNVLLNRNLRFVVSFCGILAALWLLVFIYKRSALADSKIQSISSSLQQQQRYFKSRPAASQDPPHELFLHYVRFKPDDADGVTLRFLDYLSVMSAVQRLKPDQIYLHADMEPTGKYWDELSSRGWIKYVHRAKNFSLTGRIKQLAHIYHVSDKTKLDILVEYGGIAIDWDVYFVRGERIRRYLWNHSALTCYGDQDGYNLGLAGAWKTSRLLHAWRRSFQVIYSKDWNFNCGDVQKYVSEVFAEEVYVVDRVCNNPHPDYQLADFFQQTGKIHWTDSVAIHTYHRLWKNYFVSSPEDLKKAPPSDYKELLLTIYENRTLPAEDVTFNDRVDPLAGIDF